MLPVLLLLGTATWAASCATTEPPMFSDGDCVAGGCVQSGGSSSGTTTVACTVDTSCAVHWATDIFAGILDGPAGCTGTGLCHGVGGGGLTLVSGQPDAAYTALLDYTITSGPKYIVPCSPQTSGFTCNMAVASGVTDPYTPACGIAMPFGTTGMPLTQAQLTSIANWITCGAPNN